MPYFFISEPHNKIVKLRPKTNELPVAHYGHNLELS